jgi:hypothetical protein
VQKIINRRPRRELTSLMQIKYVHQCA